MFDLLGGFVVKFLPAESLPALDRALDELSFDHVTLDGTRLVNKSALMAVLSERMGPVRLCPGPLDNWDALSDLMWQWVQGEAGKTVTKLAFVVENRSGADAELMFHFAEVCINLQAVVNDARRQDGQPGLMVRLFLIGCARQSSE